MIRHGPITATTTATAQIPHNPQPGFAGQGIYDLESTLEVLGKTGFSYFRGGNLSKHALNYRRLIAGEARLTLGRN